MGELKTITEGLCSFCSITVTGIKIMRLHSFSDEIYMMLQQMKGHEFLKSINFLKKVYKTYYRYLEEAKYQSPLHELLFCSESLSGFTTWAGVVSFDGLYVLLTMHLVTMFSSLNLIIKEASNADFNDAEKQFFLHECIKHHTRALKFVKAGGDA
ncbi:hypothetical protein pipiens_007856 [Culex pipiens pipiens]|uniref:Uncharacterized protein n=1 Tax=Culex pipiens pipiens TaxID=38569 RepID=A0ABD1DLT2_CULPP